MPVAVLGDATIDVAVRLAASMSAGGDREAAIRLGVGGQGANVAVRLARRGVPVRLVTALGDDQPGRWLAEQLEAEGVRVERVPPARSSLVVALIGPASRNATRRRKGSRRGFTPVMVAPRGGGGIVRLRQVRGVPSGRALPRHRAFGSRRAAADQRARSGVGGDGGESNSPSRTLRQRPLRACPIVFVSPGGEDRHPHPRPSHVPLDRA